MPLLKWLFFQTDVALCLGICPLKGDPLASLCDGTDSFPCHHCNSYWPLCSPQVYWHSSAHVLGEAMELYYGGHLCYGPPIENGFYYDTFIGDR